MTDRHVWTLNIDDGYLGLIVGCPYDRTDETRPCWPHDEDAAPEPVPQSDCTYEGWVEGLDATEILHGNLTIPVDCEADWSNGDYLIVHLRGLIPCGKTHVEEYAGEIEVL